MPNSVTLNAPLGSRSTQHIVIPTWATARQSELGQGGAIGTSVAASEDSESRRRV